MTRTETMLSRLSTAFATDPGTNIYKLLSLIAVELDNIEVMLTAVENAHYLNSASGKSLERIGYVVSVTRDGLESDADLRGRIIEERIKSRACGTISDIKQAVAYLLGILETDIAVIEDGPTFRIAVNVTHTKAFSFNILVTGVNATKAGGITFYDLQTVFNNKPYLETYTAGSVSEYLYRTREGFGRDAFGRSPFGGVDREINYGYGSFTEIV